MKKLFKFKKVPRGLLIVLGGVLLLFLTVAMRMVPVTRGNAIRAALGKSKYLGAISSIIKLARFETGDWTSRIYREDHNLFGMGIAGTRKQVKVGIDEAGENGRPVAIYRDDLQSAEDFLLWLQYHNTPASAIDSDSKLLKYLAEKNWWGAGVDRSETYLAAFKNY